MSELEDRDVALEILSYLWSEVIHTSPPYFGGNDFTERQSLYALALLFERLGIDAKRYRQEADKRTEYEGGVRG